MKRILLGLLTTGTVAAVAVYATNAFFSDVETSHDNILTAGTLDLQIDNTSYLNGLPSEKTSWISKDLVDEKFFDFTDIKPGDWGEDTISTHNTNDSWLCADLSLTSNLENDLTSAEVALQDSSPAGELADHVNWIWWADDGDNVLENNERVISQPGPLTSSHIVLADTTGNVWGDQGPIPHDSIRYLGKAWCLGTLTPAPLEQDEVATRTPATDNNGDHVINGLDGGVACDGSQEGNETQSDSLTADVTFRAEQSRNNSSFRCVPLTP